LKPNLNAYIRPLKYKFGTFYIPDTINTKCNTQIPAVRTNSINHCTLRATLFIPHPKPYTLSPAPLPLTKQFLQPLYSESCALHPATHTLYPTPCTLTLYSTRYTTEPDPVSGGCGSTDARSPPPRSRRRRARGRAVAPRVRARTLWCLWRDSHMPPPSVGWGGLGI